MMYLPVLLLLFSSLLLLVGGCHTIQGIITSLTLLLSHLLLFIAVSIQVWQYIYICIQYNLNYLFERKAQDDCVKYMVITD